MTSPPQQTVEYRERVPAGPQPERVRVALVGGSGVSQSDDLYSLLRRRLLALALFLSGVQVVGVAVLRYLIPLALHLIVAWFLWRRPPRSLFGLRVLEFVILAPLLVVVLMTSVSPLAFVFLEAAPREPTHVGQAYVHRYVNAGIGLWFFVITAYGALIPNTLWRAALVTGVIALSPLLLFVVYAGWVRPLDPAIIRQVLFGIGLGNAVAVALVLFSTSRIEILRQQAAEARKLGQYFLKEKLGSGGMGEVYRAEHALLRRPCALKLIRPEKAGDPATLRRFEREVQVTATLTHPNTVQIFDYGHAQDGTFYYVMEYLPGLSLEEIVRRHGPLPPGRAVHFLRQVCAALAEAHARGLTHRDIKPGNVMVCERGGIRDVVKLLDFGLVLAPKGDPDGATLTRDGVVAGTPAFMSPEQAGGQDGIDPRSDLYSVGALAYFLLTGKPPFAGRPVVKILAAHLYEPPPALPEDVPPDLSAVVMRCLAKAPAERWPDAASLETALTEVAVPAWTADDARAWWARVGSDRETGPVLATTTWAEPSYGVSIPHK